MVDNKPTYIARHPITSAIQLNLSINKPFIRSICWRTHFQGLEEKNRVGNPQGPNKVESLLPEKGCLPPLLDQKGVTERFP